MGGNAREGAGRLDALIVKVASRCNLNCSYCYLYNHEDDGYRRQPKFMAEAVFRRAMERALAFLEQGTANQAISIVLHGGEPSLAGARRLDAYCAIAAEVLGPRLAVLAMQTNGTLLAPDIIEVIKRRGVQLGVSMDGPLEAHNQARIFRNGASSYERTLAGVRTLAREGLPLRILCVVQPGQDGAAVYDHFRMLGVEHFDFLLPDVSHDNRDRLYGKAGPRPVSRFLIAAFDRWLAENNPAVRIRLFSSLIRSQLGGTAQSDAFGGGLMSYAVIETNGDIEALDALKVCRNGIAKTGLNVETDAFEAIRFGDSVLSRAMYGRIPPAKACTKCPEFGHCGGGYLPHRYSHSGEFDNPSVWCEDLKDLFQHVRACVARHAA